MLEKEIERFLAVSSDNSDDSSSDFNDGYGSGYGSGFGYAFGSGDSSGDGCGNGDGSGFGHGYGFGYGLNSSGGSGDSSGFEEFNGRKVYYIDAIPTLIYAVRGNVARVAVIRDDLTTKDCWVARREDFFAHGRTLHEAVEDVDAKWRENRPLEERIAEFVKTHPALDKLYDDLFKWHHTLTGSCEFGRLDWCRRHGYKPTDSITLRTFFEKTKDYYGGNIIKRVAKEYEINLG